MGRKFFLAVALLISSGAALLAEEKVTVEATSKDISEGLDLKMVANVFGEVKDLSEFEEKLNSDTLHLSNLDLNGDGKVDYLRVVETAEESSRHVVLIQAVLAKDIFQDVAAIYVEKDEEGNVDVQVKGDSLVFDKDFIVKPAYIYRPQIYDSFWSPNWVCYSSPWNWGYWPGWYNPYPCWVSNRYWTHVYVYHYDHPRCSYSTSRAPHSGGTATATRVSPVSRASAPTYSSRSSNKSRSESGSRNSSGSTSERNYSSTSSSRSYSTPTSTRNYSTQSYGSSSSNTRNSSYSSYSSSSGSTRNYSSGSSSYRSSSGSSRSSSSSSSGSSGSSSGSRNYSSGSSTRR